MGFLNWCEDRWGMMMRTKPHYISVLGRKRSSVKGTQKLSPRQSGKKFGIFLCGVSMCCSVLYGVLLVLSGDLDPAKLTTYLISAIIAGTASMASGFCLAEYISTHSEEMPSIYSCCYQYSSEVLAFFIGWTWLISQVAVISALCKILTYHVDRWTDGVLQEFLQDVFYDYAKDMPSLLFLLAFVLFILTGLGETVLWYSLFVPVAFGMMAAVIAISFVSNNSHPSLYNFQWNDIEGINEVLESAAVSTLFFSGPQSILRIPPANLHGQVPKVLGPLNAINLLLSLAFIMTATLSGGLTSCTYTGKPVCLTSNVLYVIALCSLIIEAFHSLHFVIEDMSGDGLLFRSLSRKWKPFCFPVPSVLVLVLTLMISGFVCVFMPLKQVLNLAVIFPLLVNTVVPFLVFIQRYKDNNSWRYELMQNTSQHLTKDRSMKENLEFQYSNCPGFDVNEESSITSCINGNMSDSTSSDTDIDSVVEQYKEQTRIANIASLEESPGSDDMPEPTISSFFKAKLCIIMLMIISLSISILLNFTEITDNLPILITVVLFVIFSVIVNGFLLCLPRNRNADEAERRCLKFASVPWIPGIASLISTSLFVQSLIQTWEVYLSYILLGLIVYFSYGIRSSTAASSFHNMKTTHIALKPLPSYGNNCIPQIIPAQQKPAKWRKKRKLKTYVQ